jgi:hypothetical protein
VFDWFDLNGATSRPVTGSPLVRGVNAQVASSFKSPNVMEYSTGVNRQFGNSTALRADLVYRKYRDFYSQRTDLSTGQVTDDRPSAPAGVAGREYDLTLLENTNAYERQYAGLMAQATFRRHSVDAGIAYSISRAWGSIDGETYAGGPSISDLASYPEYKRAAWYAPSGDLSIDQRHKARLWLNYTVPRLSGLTLSTLQTLESGVPYGAVAADFNVRPFVQDPGYATPPGAGQIGYYYTSRDAFRTEGPKRTDFGINYTRAMPGARRVRLFGQLQIINLFNQFQLCGCGGTVFVNGGGVVLSQTIDTTVRTTVINAARTPSFNPFTTVPVEGRDWNKGANFGHALSRFAYTTPRMLRVSFGVRF